MYLFFDTETTGLPKNWKAPVTDTDNWPRMVQIAYLFYDKYGKKLAGEDFIIKPEGYTIPIESSKIHGITTEMAMDRGEDLGEILQYFQKLIDHANLLVAHNMSFDEKIIGAEYIRKKMPDGIAPKRKLCTMKSSIDYCKIPGKYGNKWPTLAELHYKLFKKGFEDAHDAAIDIEATAKCFWELKRLRVI